MKHLARIAVMVAAGWAAGSTCLAQRAPQIGYVFPAGGKTGTTFDLVIGGQHLFQATDIHVTGAGITAKVHDRHKPISGKQTGIIRDRAEQARKRVNDERDQEKRRPSPRDLDEFLKIMRELGTTDEELEMLAIERHQRADPKRQPNAQLAETVTFRVTIAPDAKAGPRDLRVMTPAGLSNPMIFHVGHLPEFTETPAKIPVGWAFGLRPPAIVTPIPQPVALPATVNGQVLPGEVDTCRFVARKDQLIVAVVQARALVPYMADAVPGWFQAVASIHDAQDREIAYADDYRFDPDPALVCRIPADGEYTLKIRDSIYRGREDFVYRVHVGELPFVTSVFPLGATVGAKPELELRGWNLSGLKLKPDTSQAGARWLHVQRDRLISNLVAFKVENMPETFEVEPNNAPAHAQPSTWPVVVNGRIDQPGDVDVVRIDGRAGDILVAEVCARRLKSPLDSMLRLTDAGGKVLAQNDDFEDKGSGWNTHHADSYVRHTLPVAGAYFLHVGDTQRKGGPDYAYRLRISPPQPGFDLRVVPSTVNLRPGGNAVVTVYAVRRDGFDGEIALHLDDAPEGFNLTGATSIPAGKDDAKVTLVVGANAATGPVAVRMVGRTIIDEQAIVRPVVPADDLMQAFFYRHLVTTREWVVTVLGRPSSPAKASTR